MTTYLGKSCSFGLLPSIYVFCYFPFGFEGRMWDLIVSVPDHCLSFYFVNLTQSYGTLMLPKGICKEILLKHLADYVFFTSLIALR